MENYNILETLFWDYRVSQNNEEHNQVITEFNQTLRAYIKDRDTIIDLEDSANNIEFTTSKLFFKAGFKYAMQLMRECGLI